MKKNIVANFVGRFWSILSNFLFIPLYIHYLGFESYSVISFTLMITGIMAVLDGGLTATLSREFARKDNNEEEKLKIFKNLETVYFIIIGICVLLIFSTSNLIAEKWLNLDSISPASISLFLKIISFEIGFQLLFRFYTGGLLGLEKQVIANIFQVGWGILRNGVVVIALIFIPTLELFFAWQAISTVVFTIFLKIYLNKTLSGKYKFQINFSFEKAVFSKIWKFTGGMMLIALVSALNTQLDKISISNLLSLENLGYYTLAVSLSQGLIIIVNPITTALLPRFTALFSTNDKQQAQHLYLKASLLISIVIFSITIVLTFFADDIIWIWTGQSEIAEKVFRILPVVALAYSMFALQLLPYNIAIANGYTKLNNVLGIASLLITIPGYYLATKSYGAIGAAVVFCVVQVVTTFIYLYFINKKFIHASVFKEVFGKQILLPLLITATIGFLFSNVSLPIENNRLISLLWIGFVTFATLAISLAVLIPFKELKLIMNSKKK